MIQQNALMIKFTVYFLNIKQNSLTENVVVSQFTIVKLLNLWIVKNKFQERTNGSINSLISVHLNDFTNKNMRWQWVHIDLQF